MKDAKLRDKNADRTKAKAAEPKAKADAKAKPAAKVKSASRKRTTAGDDEPSAKRGK